MYIKRIVAASFVAAIAIGTSAASAQQKIGDFLSNRNLPGKSSPPCAKCDLTDAEKVKKGDPPPQPPAQTSESSSGSQPPNSQ